MDVENKLVSLVALLCETSRARVLYNLHNFRDYTASELSLVADTSPASARNHL